MAQTDNAATRFVDLHLDAGRADKPAFREVDGEPVSYTHLTLPTMFEV